MTTDALRLFFALVPPPPVRGKIAEVQRRLSLPARPVPVENLHITLAFLGNVCADRIPRLASLMDTTTFPACRLVLDRLGIFSGVGVAWLGCSTVPPSLLRFHARLTEGLEAADFRVETRRWKPHVTLYRKLRTPFEKMAFEPVSWNLDGYCLMQSRRGEGGPEYLQLERRSTLRERD